MTCDGLWPTPTTDSASNRSSRYKQGGMPLAVAAKGLSSSPVGSLANLIPLQESVKRLLTIVTCGPNLPVSFARFARDGSSQRMYPASCTPSLDGSLVPFSGTWPTWGIARDGACGELPTLERCTAANESSSWPTPNAADNRDRGNLSNPAVQRRMAVGKQLDLSMVVSPDSGALNPEWVEGLMGFQIGWTDLSDGG
jgi:hypothetical protein